MEFTQDEFFWYTQSSTNLWPGTFKITVVPEGEGSPVSEGQIRSISFLNQLPPALVDDVRKRMFAYYQEVADMVDLSDDMPEIGIEDVHRYYRITEIVIPRMGSSTSRFLFLTGECEWEPEHGFEILVKDGVALSCGMQDALYLNEEWGDHIGK